YVANVVQANLLAMTADNVSGMTMNAACHRAVTLNQLVVHLNRILGTSIDAIHDAPRSGDIRHSLADIEYAKEALGYTPLVGFEDGLRLSVQALLEAQHEPL
ncbi:MAG TPA: LPS biosynthesis protein WbpP, partial [Anaerolineae bacterium]|nr:LPS biosynthesis protein WbpP [Anaerolineae bacterium]